VYSAIDLKELQNCRRRLRHDSVSIELDERVISFPSHIARMKIAFLIAAHTYPELLVRLVRRLQSPVASIFIHIDKDADIHPFKELFLREEILDVYWVPRVRCRWGTFDQVKASLSLLREALRMDHKADMYMLRTGLSPSNGRVHGKLF
jgi:hypothetical protein